MAVMRNRAPVLLTSLSACLLALACGDAPANNSQTSAAPAGSAAPAPENAASQVLANAAPTREIEDMTKAIASLGPHKQTNLPPIPFAAYAPPRPPDVVTAAYLFAAEHPEISAYVPCFCGCQQGGHKGNHDCFVRSRAANGDVIEWEPHGVECAVCIDVATRSRQLLASGASLADIRAAVEKEYLPIASTMTPTPKPPAAHGH